MINKRTAKFIKSLQLKKYRKEEQCFVVEGEKGALESIRSGFEILIVAGTESFMTRNSQVLKHTEAELITTDEQQLVTLGSFQSNDSCIAVLRQKPNQVRALNPNEFCLVLDGIKDPGNLGTIVRTADWFGIRMLIVSEDTTDFYSPKVINATMGSFARVEVAYTSIPTYLSEQSAPIFGAFLEGEDVHTCDFGQSGLIVIGNESNGISSAVKKYVGHPITIPGHAGAESLNASVATGIILDNLRRSNK